MLCESSLLLVLVPAPRVFRRVLRFSGSLHKKTTIPNSNSIWKQWMKSHYVDMPLQIPIYFSFICHYIGNKTLSFGLQAFCFSQFSLKLLIICRDNLIAGQLCTILANSKSRENKYTLNLRIYFIRISRLKLARF